MGRGAGARFRVTAPGNRFSWGDMTFAEVDRPHRIVEVGRTGKGNRIRTLGVYEALPGHRRRDTGTVHSGDPAEHLSDRLLESLGRGAGCGARTRRRCAGCNSIVERGEGRGARVTVAGG